MNHYIRLMRPKQWIKNLLVLFGLVFSGQWKNSALLGSACLATLAFCVMASSLYICNDYYDKHLDQRHPNKHHRPLASGQVKLPMAFSLALLLFIVAIALAVIVSSMTVILLLSYAILMFAYSRGLKRIPLLDLLIVATGFLMRILVGTVGLAIPPSSLLLLCTFLLALFLIACKRQAELLNTTPRVHSPVTRISLLYYSPKSLNYLIHTTALSLMFSYGYYTWQHPSTQVFQGHFGLLYTWPVVLIGLGRCYQLLYFKHQGEDLTNDYFFDKIILILAMLWLTILLCLLP